jgi:photosystem II stability/assembly factor-like uncharacterized protein
MKTTLTIIIFSLFTFHSLAQQYGWVDMSSHVPATISNANLTDVSVVGESVWISTSNLGGVYRSSDGGNSFAFDSMAVGIQGLYRYPDGQRGWAVGGDWAYHTTDNGQNWTPVFIGSTLLSITFANDSVGYATGLNGTVFRTDNNGLTWALQSVPGNLNRDVFDAAFPDSLNPFKGYVCLANGISTIYSTTTGGANWNLVTLTMVTSCVIDFDFIDPSLGWAVGGYGNIFKFYNNSWTYEISPFTATLNAVSATNLGNDVWAVGNIGTTGLILHRDQNGNWAHQVLGQILDIMQGVDAVDEHTVYAVGTNKTFMKYTQLSGIENKELFSGINIYPNPALNNLNIECPQIQNFNVTLFNLLGEQVMQRELKGTKEPIDISTLPAGMYIVKVSGEDWTVQKKLIKE